MANNVGSVTIVNNTDLVREALQRATTLALEGIGAKAEEWTKKNMTNDVPDAIDTGYLRNSITYAVAGKEAHVKSYTDDKGGKREGFGGYYNGTAPETEKPSVFVGTNVEYGVFIEEGTGRHAAGGKGRKDPWVYKDEKTGQPRVTGGSKAHHMLRRAATEHTDEYENIVKAAFEAAE